MLQQVVSQTVKETSVVAIWSRSSAVDEIHARKI